MSDNKTITLSIPAKFAIRRLREEKEQICKSAGRNSKTKVQYYKSGYKFPIQALNELYQNGLISVYDVHKSQTWYELTPLGKTINIDQ